MNILICGLGSMGERRIRLLLGLNLENCKIFGTDIKEERCNNIKKKYAINTFDSIESAVSLEKMDVAFICTAPVTHCEIILKCLNFNLDIFTELNVVSDGYEQILALAAKLNKKVFLSSTLNYRKDIQYIQNIVHDSKDKFNYVYHVGQFLPDWHPWENYKNFFVSNKRTSGCREIMAVDLPWIIKTFGEIENVSCIKNKISNLEIDYPDNFIVIIQHKNGHKGVFVVDIVCRKAVRKLEVYSQNKYISWDGHPSTLSEYDIESKKEVRINCYTKELDNNENYSRNIVENAYEDEIKAFIDYIMNGTIPIYGFLDDKYVLDIINKIEV